MKRPVCILIICNRITPFHPRVTEIDGKMLETRALGESWQNSSSEYRMVGMGFGTFPGRAQPLFIHHDIIIRKKKNVALGSCHGRIQGLTFS